MVDYSHASSGVEDLDPAEVREHAELLMDAGVCVDEASAIAIAQNDLLAKHRRREEERREREEAARRQNIPPPPRHAPAGHGKPKTRIICY